MKLTPLGVFLGLVGLAFSTGFGAFVAGVYLVIDAAYKAASQATYSPGIKTLGETGGILLIIGLAVMGVSLGIFYAVRKE